MPIVSNTSPILNLAIIGQLDLLYQFDQVLVPPAVLTELQPESNLPGAPAIRKALQAHQLQTTALTDIRLARVLALELDQGEAEAIALALELGVKHILMDEHDGRAKAKSLGLRPVGILGILLRAKRDGKLDSVHAAMQALRRQAGFFIAQPLFLEILYEAGEQVAQSPGRSATRSP